MSDGSATPTHSAAWHYGQAEALLSRASRYAGSVGPDELDHTRLPNPKVQEHLVAKAQVHATLALAGATVLAGLPHGHAGRKTLIEHAEGEGVRER